jgi:hypothetical protein
LSGVADLDRTFGPVMIAPRRMKKGRRSMKRSRQKPQINWTRAVWRGSRWRVLLWCVAGVLLVLALAITIIQPQAMWTNLAAEAAGLAFTVLAIDVIAVRQSEEREKRDLILQMGSPDNAFAREAVRKLRAWEWLTDGSLIWADLSEANLSEVDLSEADLSEVGLREAKLAGASLIGADLSGADLRGADLSRAELRRAKVSGADLSGAKLSGADLIGADLSGAKLSGADLTRAKITRRQLAQARTLEGATMPDGTVHG